MTDDSSVPFTVEFSQRARILEYRDPALRLDFSFDVVNAQDPALVLEHHEPHRRRDPRSA